MAASKTSSTPSMRRALHSFNSTYPACYTNADLLPQLLFNNSTGFVYSPSYCSLYILCTSFVHLLYIPSSVRTKLGNGLGALWASPRHQAVELWEFPAVARLLWLPSAPRPPPPSIPSREDYRSWEFPPLAPSSWTWGRLSPFHVDVHYMNNKYISR